MQLSTAYQFNDLNKKKQTNILSLIRSLKSLVAKTKLSPRTKLFATSLDPQKWLHSDRMLTTNQLAGQAAPRQNYCNFVATEKHRKKIRN